MTSQQSQWKKLSAEPAVELYCTHTSPAELLWRARKCLARVESMEVTWTSLCFQERRSLNPLGI